MPGACYSLYGFTGQEIQPAAVVFQAVRARKKNPSGAQSVEM